MKEFDKIKSHISSKLHIIYINSTNIRNPVIKTFITLHYTSSKYTSIHSNTLVDTSLPLI